MPHVGQEMLTLSGTHDFTPLGRFCSFVVCSLYITEFVNLGLCLRIGGSGLFAWIGLAACLGLILLMHTTSHVSIVAVYSLRIIRHMRSEEEDEVHCGDPLGAGNNRQCDVFRGVLHGSVRYC